MELVSNEIIYVDINANEEDVLKTVVFETTGSGKISRCVDWFVNERTIKKCFPTSFRA